MKAKKKKALQRWVLYFLVAVFVLGTVLLYLPVANQSQTSTPPPEANVQGGPENGQFPPEVQQKLQEQQNQQSQQQGPAAPAQPGQ